MDVLFLHGNYPGQFWHLAEGMGRKPSNRVVFLTNRSDPELHRLAGVEVRRYEPHREVNQGGHSYLHSSERGVLAGQAVVRSLSVLLQEGFRPRLVIAHGGNGLLLFLRQLLPKSCLVGYFEWWFSDQQAPWLFGADSLDARMRMVCRNGITLQELELCDLAVTPTAWQRSQFPLAQQQRLQVVFDGVDTGLFRPEPWCGEVLLQGDVAEEPFRLQPESRILSYATRGMEPLRGFPEFMRMLPALMQRFGDLEVVVAGRDRVAYSYSAPSHGGSWKKRLLAELGDKIDRSRLHFTGLLNYGDYVRLLQRSDLHAMFSRPYVTSWGLFQAAACGSKLMVNQDPSIDYVLENQQVLRVDLDQPEQLLDRAADWLDRTFHRREIQQESMLKPQWELNSCLQQWQKLLNQALTVQTSGS